VGPFGYQGFASDEGSHKKSKGLIPRSGWQRRAWVGAQRNSRKLLIEDNSQPAKRVKGLNRDAIARSTGRPFDLRKRADSNGRLNIS
jgi:hypothetical protein